MELEIRSIRPDEFATYVRTLEAAFSAPLSDEQVEDDRTVAEPDRQLAAFDDGDVVGGSSVATLRMSAPGGRTVPAAGIKQVGVLPSHRRQGINTALMRRQLDDINERGEPVAILHASEAVIYRRFGFGQATFVADLNMETRAAAFLPGYQPRGRVRLLPHDEALPRMRPVYDAVAAARPGMVVVDDRWFTWRFSSVHRENALPRYYAVHETAEGEADAYAVYVVDHVWPAETPQLVLTVRELMATTPQATADIWRFVFDIDLVDTVIAGKRPADDPLWWLMAEPRRMRFTFSDGMYVRLVDVPAALEARGYAADGTVTLDVRDAFCPWNEGTYVLAASKGSATCARTDAPPDLACDVTELGATYLGGATFAQLASAGRIEERTEGALTRADAIFRSEPAPWCSLPI